MVPFLRALRTITATPGRGCTRLAYSHYEDAAHDLVWERLRPIDGLVRIEDAAGNLFVVPRRAVTHADAIVLVGSHLDTVIEGGWLDGALGVAAGVHVLRRRARGGRADPHVGLVVFRDEEGVRFSTGLFGSKVFAGRCDAADLDVTDPLGVRLRDVVVEPRACCRYAPPVRAAAYLECHIEQGQRLLEHDAAIGIVEAIVGIRRFALTATGHANHAGTTDMRRRVDALVPVAEIVSQLPNVVEAVPDAVATCGAIAATPGAPNVVPGAAHAVIELRAGTERDLDRMSRRVRDLVAALAPAVPGGRLAAVELAPLESVPPIALHGRLQSLLADATGSCGAVATPLLSMAGHDAQNAAHRCPSAMFFIPSVGGVSHNPAEDSAPEHIALAGRVMEQWVADCVAAGITDVH